VYRFDGSTVLVIKTDVTYTVTHQNDTHSHTRRAAKTRTGVLISMSASVLEYGARVPHALDGGEAKNTGSGRSLA